MCRLLRIALYTFVFHPVDKHLQPEICQINPALALKGSGKHGAWWEAKTETRKIKFHVGLRQSDSSMHELKIKIIVTAQMSLKGGSVTMRPVNCNEDARWVRELSHRPGRTRLFSCGS